MHRGDTAEEEICKLEKRSKVTFHIAQKDKEIDNVKDNQTWRIQMQAIVYGMDKQQGPTVQHREFYSIACDKQ